MLVINVITSTINHTCLKIKQLSCRSFSPSLALICEADRRRCFPSFAFTNLEHLPCGCPAITDKKSLNPPSKSLFQASLQSGAVTAWRYLFTEISNSYIACRICTNAWLIILGSQNIFLRKNMFLFLCRVISSKRTCVIVSGLYFVATYHALLGNCFRFWVLFRLFELRFALGCWFWLMIKKLFKLELV